MCVILIHITCCLLLFVGEGIVSSTKQLESSLTYRITVRSSSFDTQLSTVEYQTTFIIYISVSQFPFWRYDHTTWFSCCIFLFSACSLPNHNICKCHGNYWRIEFLVHEAVSWNRWCIANSKRCMRDRVYLYRQLDSLVIGLCDGTWWIIVWSPYDLMRYKKWNGC